MPYLSEGGTSHSLSQHEHTLIILYQGKASQLSICLKADVIILQSDQVDEDLSQLILALPGRARISVHSQLDTSKIDLIISQKYKYQSFIHIPPICLSLASLQPVQRPPSWILVFSVVIPLSDLSRLSYLTSSSTLLHLLYEVYHHSMQTPMMYIPTSCLHGGKMSCLHGSHHMQTLMTSHWVYATHMHPHDNVPK